MKYVLQRKYTKLNLIVGTFGLILLKRTFRAHWPTIMSIKGFENWQGFSSCYKTFSF